jgi:lipase
MPAPPFESTVSVKNLDLKVYEWPGAEPAVLLCHATGFHARCWDQIAARMEGRRRIAADFRGHGRSAKPPAPYRSWRPFGEDLAELTRSLGLKGALAAGHSMGGHAATLAAALNPGAFSRLLLIDPVIRAKGDYRGPWEPARFVAQRRNAFASAQEMFERFANREPFAKWDPAVLRDYCEYGLLPEDGHFALACPPAVEASIYEHSSVPESDIYGEIATIEIPVNVVRSARAFDGRGFDMSASPTAPDLAQSFRHATDLRVEEYSHFIPMEAPQLVAAWIEELAGSSGNHAL